MVDNGIRVELFDADADPSAVDRDTRVLRDELLDIDEVDAVAAAIDGPAPPGTRSVDVQSLGALVVSVRPTVEVVAHVVSVLRGWLAAGLHAGQTARSLRVTVNGQSLELSAATAEEQQALVEQFIKAAGVR
jgi:hypothetical protein